MFIALVGYNTAISLDPDLIYTVAEEYEEMTRMSVLINERQQQQHLALRDVSDKQEAEVARCFLNLSSRAQVG